MISLPVGMGDCAMQIIKKDGPLGFYKVCRRMSGAGSLVPSLPSVR
jgi:hypothetical protein